MITEILSIFQLPKSIMELNTTIETYLDYLSKKEVNIIDERATDS